MHAVVAPIYMGLATLLAFAESEYVTRQETEWKHYNYDEILKDLHSFLNQSELDLFNHTVKRYPGLIDVFLNTLSEVVANDSLSQDIFCTQIDIAIRGMIDLCKKPIDEALRDASLGKACHRNVYNATLYDPRLSRFCQAQFYISEMNRTSKSVSFSSGSLFYALKVLVGTVSVAAKRWCEGIGGTFEDDTFLCFKNGSVIEVSKLKDKWLQTIMTVGSSISFTSLAILLITYVAFKKYNNLGGKNIICLSSSLIIVHLLLIILEYLNDNKVICRVGAVMLHFSLLLAFSWMAIIAFEFCHTFSKIRPVQQYERRKRFHRYLVISFLSSLSISFICLMIDIPDERYAGYGLNGVCFVSRFWANLLAYVVPVAIVLIFNVYFLTSTIWNLHKESASTSKSLHSSSNKVAKKREMVLSVMTLKLSILFGFGWIFGFIEASYESKVMKYIYTIIISLQGFLVFLAFGCHKELWELVQQKSKYEPQQTALQMNDFLEKPGRS